MAKKKQPTSSSPSSVSKYWIIGFAALGILGWAFWQKSPFERWKEEVFHYIDNQEIATLEARFSPEQIVESHKVDILGSDAKRSLKNASLVYYPFLLLNIKYTADQKTKEGVLLWGLNQGEIVLNSQTWEETHGFRDCLECHANAHDFKIIQALAKKNGGLSLEELEKDLRVERETLNLWLKDAKQKHLIVQNGNLFSLHFENPKLLVVPQTQITHALVKKELGTSEKVPRRFSRSEVLASAQAAFGPGFTVRSEQEIYLPVYRLKVMNWDKSIQMSEWNALNGQKIVPRDSI